MKPYLGQKVAVTDHLFRTDGLTAKQVVAIGEEWEYIPKRTLESAKERLPADRNPHISLASNYKVWLPVSLNPYRYDGRWGWISSDTRRHPVIVDLPMPMEGIVTRQVMLQDGERFYEEFGPEFAAMDRHVGYQVTYHLNRRPLVVLPHMIEES